MASKKKATKIPSKKKALKRAVKSPTKKVKAAKLPKTAKGSKKLVKKAIKVTKARQEKPLKAQKKTTPISNKKLVKAIDHVATLISYEIMSAALSETADASLIATIEKVLAKHSDELSLLTSNQQASADIINAAALKELNKSVKAQLSVGKSRLSTAIQAQLNIFSAANSKSQLDSSATSTLSSLADAV